MLPTAGRPVDPAAPPVFAAPLESSDAELLPLGQPAAPGRNTAPA